MKRKIVLLFVVGVCALVTIGLAFGADGSESSLEQADKLFGLHKYEQAEQIR